MGELSGGTARWNDTAGPVTTVEAPPAFEEFFEDERDRLFRVLCVITGNRYEAEDLCQDAFARVWERWDAVATMANPTGYLHRTAMNQFRSRYRRSVLAARRGIARIPQDDAYQAIDEHEVALQVLRTLAPRQRAAIVLTEVLGYTAEEAGGFLGIRAATVRALHFQARSALKNLRGGRDD